MSDFQLYKASPGSNPAKPVAGYGVSGEYLITRKQQGAPPWPANVRFRAGDHDKPVAVIFPGYRMQGVSGRTCNKLANMLAAQNFPSLIIDFGGFLPSYFPERDPATLETNLQDARAALHFLEDRPTIFMPLSFGINIAMPLLNAHVQGVVACAPAPNIITRHIIPCMLDGDYKHVTRKTGFTTVGFGRGETQLKITRAFFDSASDRYSLFNGGWKHRPPVKLLSSRNDPVLPWRMVPDWMSHLKAQGFDVAHLSFPQGGHNFEGWFLQQGVAQAIDLASRQGRKASPAENILPVDFSVPEVVAQAQSEAQPAAVRQGHLWEMTPAS